MTNCKKTNTRAFPGMKLREDLRHQAVTLSRDLDRSVARKTSYDAVPCPEYTDTVRGQYELVNRLLYVQNCRKTLEACLQSGFARLRFRNPDGTVTRTWFKRASLGRVVAGGLKI